jgi:hypothetical protein
VKRESSRRGGAGDRPPTEQSQIDKKTPQQRLERRLTAPEETSLQPRQRVGLPRRVLITPRRARKRVISR